jgi:hypothetical protein
MVIENNKQGLVIGVWQFSVSRLYHLVLKSLSWEVCDSKL